MWLVSWTITPLMTSWGIFLVVFNCSSSHFFLGVFAVPSLGSWKYLLLLALNNATFKCVHLSQLLRTTGWYIWQRYLVSVSSCLACSNSSTDPTRIPAILGPMLDFMHLWRFFFYFWGVIFVLQARCSCKSCYWFDFLLSGESDASEISL